ncbi:MAG: FAD-dependent oxidoreductase [Pseudomonadota bacterium]
MTQPDVLVIGAGIFGLSVAWAAKRRGLSVQVLEAVAPGHGASGGLVGALTPHAPSRWRPMMRFQFEALLSLSDHIAELEEQTGIGTGYQRSGRLTPLTSEKARAGAERDVEAAPQVWGKCAQFQIVEDVPAEASDWIRPEAAPFGLVRDSISARVDPRAYVDALAHAIGADVRAGVQVQSIDFDAKTVSSDAGLHSTGAIVLAAGWQVWDLLGSAAPALRGQPVKGQSALFAAVAEDLPVIYQDGLYIVPHSGGRVAVGSTSEKQFDDPLSTDDRLDQVIEKARNICPALMDAPVLERWAGLRPKPPGREPVIGPVPGHPDIWLAAGGYKISFGIAHAVAEAVVAGLTGVETDLPLPKSFDPSNAGEA